MRIDNIGGIMELFFGVLFASIVVEGIVTYVDTIFVNGKVQWKLIVSIAVGILIACAFGMDLFSLLNINSNIPFIGNIITGILISRGSNYIFDLLGKVADKVITNDDKPNIIE